MKQKLEDYHVGQIVSIWIKQGHYPYRDREIEKIDLTQRKIWIKGQSMYYTELEFLESLNNK